MLVFVFFAGLNSCSEDDNLTLMDSSTIAIPHDVDMTSRTSSFISGMTIGEYHNSLMSKQKAHLEDLKSIGVEDSILILESLKINLKESLIEDLKISSQEYDRFIQDITKIEYVSRNSDVTLQGQLELALNQFNNEALANDLRLLVN